MFIKYILKFTFFHSKYILVLTYNDEDPDKNCKSNSPQLPLYGLIIYIRYSENKSIFNQVIELVFREGKKTILNNFQKNIKNIYEI